MGKPVIAEKPVFEGEQPTLARAIPKFQLFNSLANRVLRGVIEPLKPTDVKTRQAVVREQQSTMLSKTAIRLTHQLRHAFPELSEGVELVAPEQPFLASVAGISATVDGRHVTEASVDIFPRGHDQRRPSARLALHSVELESSDGRPDPLNSYAFIGYENPKERGSRVYKEGEYDHPEEHRRFIAVARELFQDIGVAVDACSIGQKPILDVEAERLIRQSCSMDSSVNLGRLAIA